MRFNFVFWIRAALIFAAIFFIFEAIIHFFNLKLESTYGHWESSAITYASLINKLYASFILLAAVLALIGQSDIKKYKAMVIVSAIWSLLHGLMLIILNFSYNFSREFNTYFSLSLYLPRYDIGLITEGVLLILYGILVISWWWSSKKTT